MTPRTCLVIGGRGFVGSAMSAHARERGMDVTAVGRGDYATVVGRHFDVVVFAAGNARRYIAERDPAADLEASVGAVHRAMSDVASGCFVLVSTVDVYPDATRLEATREDARIDASALPVYGFHKRMAELVVARGAPEWLTVRLGQMVGPGLRKGPVYDALAGDPLWVDPDSRYPFLRTSSVAAITFELLREGARNRPFNVCGRGSASLSEVLPERPATRPDAPTERYAIDVGAAAARCAVPEAADELRAFLEPAC